MLRLFAVDLRLVDFLAAGLRADVLFFAVDFLRAAGLRAAVFRFLVDLRLAVDFFFAVDFFAADLRRVVFLAVVFRFLVAAPFLAAAERLTLFRFLVAAAFLAAVDFFLAGDIGHPLPLLRTPCASGVAVPVRSSRPTRRIARRDEARS